MSGLTVFSKQSGSVVLFNDPALPARAKGVVSPEGFGGFQGLRSVITSVSLASKGNFDFLHSLGGAIYVYVFGDRIGQVTLSGLCFPDGCDQEGLLGIERLVSDFYSPNRIASRDTIMSVTLGQRSTLKGYLVGLDANLVDTKTRIWEFHMQLAWIPPARRRKRNKPAIPSTATGTGADANPDVDFTDPVEPETADTRAAAGFPAGDRGGGVTDPELHAFSALEGYSDDVGGFAVGAAFPLALPYALS